MSPRRSPGDGHIFKRADGMWVAGVEMAPVYVNGTLKRRQRRVTAKSRAECLRKYRELKAAIEAGIVPGTGAVKVGKYLEDWLENVHRLRVKPSTYPDDARIIRLHILPRIGAKRLDRLMPDEINTVLVEIQATGKTRLAQQAYQLLGGALSDAVKRRVIAYNPVAVLDKPKHKYKRHPPFAPEVALHVMDFAKTYRDETWSARWSAGFMTGCRESELLGLRWSYVDLDNKLLDVSWQLQELDKSHGCGEPVDGKYPCGKVRMSFCPQAHWNFPPGFEYELCERSLVWTKPKSQRSDRGVPIMTPLRLILTDLKANDGHNPHDLVFHHPDGTPITQSQDQKAWRKLLVDAGVPHAPQHTLRRTAASLLRKAGVDEQTRMALFGHASVDVQRLYAQDDWAAEMAAMDSLADELAPKNLDDEPAPAKQTIGMIFKPFT